MVGSRGSAYTETEQSLAQSRTQCTGRELLTNHFSLCARIFKTIILFCSPCQGVIPKGHMKRQTRKKIRRRTDTPTSFPVSILSVQFSESHLQAHSFLSHVSHASNTLVSLATVDSSEEFVCAFAMKQFHHCSFFLLLLFTMHHGLGFFKLFFTLNKWFEFHGNMFICFLGKSYHLF